MSFRPSSFASLAAVALVAGSFTSTSALAVVPDSASAVDTDDKGLALQGYDPVAYFTGGEPQKGTPNFKIKRDDPRPVLPVASVTTAPSYEPLFNLEHA